jgi:hypothetical protein
MKKRINHDCLKIYIHKFQGSKYCAKNMPHQSQKNPKMRTFTIHFISVQKYTWIICTMNKLIKHHWKQFNHIIGSKNFKTQFPPCKKLLSHIARCINNIKIYFSLTSTSSGNRNLTFVWYISLGYKQEKNIHMSFKLFTNMKTLCCPIFLLFF